MVALLLQLGLEVSHCLLQILRNRIVLRRGLLRLLAARVGRLKLSGALRKLLAKALQLGVLCGQSLYILTVLSALRIAIC